MIQLTIDQEIIIAKTARKLNISFDKVREVFESDYRTMVQKIKGFNWEDDKTHYVFLLPNFGKFALNSQRAKKIYGIKEINTEPGQE